MTATWTWSMGCLGHVYLCYWCTPQIMSVQTTDSEKQECSRKVMLMVFNPWDSHHPTFSLQTLTLSYINSLKLTPWTVACQTTLSSTISWSLLKRMSTESVVLSNHLILYHPLLLSPSIFLSIKVFSSEWPVCIRRPSIGVSALASVLRTNISW